MIPLDPLSCASVLVPKLGLQAHVLFAPLPELGSWSLSCRLFRSSVPWGLPLQGSPTGPLTTDLGGRLPVVGVKRGGRVL